MPRAVLRDFIFGKVNGAQSENQGNFWKIDSIGFPTGHHGGNFYIGKVIKTWLQVDPFSTCEGAALSDLTVHFWPKVKKRHSLIEKRYFNVF